MRTTARCSCGWRRELSEFYAGRRIRCPDCACILEVPGELAGTAAGLYTSPRLEGELRRATPRRGVWLPLVPRYCDATPTPPARPNIIERMPAWVLLLLAAGAVLFFILIANPAKRGRASQPLPDLTEPALERPPALPKAPVPVPDSDPDSDPEEVDEF